MSIWGKGPLLVISTGWVFQAWVRSRGSKCASEELLDYLNENVVFHHDLKSPNILLDENCSAKVTSFGLSKLVIEIEKTHLTIDVK